MGPASDHVILGRAKALRSQQTDAEIVLWRLLRAKRFKHTKFVRQAPIGKYIVDFCCFGQRLVVEVDGGQHDAGKKRDLVRSRFLESQGFTVLRYWNNDVLGNLEGVAFEIDRAMRDSSRYVDVQGHQESEERHVGHPLPSPPPSRGRGAP